MRRWEYIIAGAVVLAALVAAIVLAVVPIPASGEPKTKPCTQTFDATPAACSLLVVVRDGLRCAIYQSGGPNSARLWCEDIERPSTGAPAAGGGG